MKQMLTDQRSFFASGRTLDLDFRLEQLRKLLNLVERHETEILLALHQDLRKPPLEAFASEVGHVIRELRH